MSYFHIRDTTALCILLFIAGLLLGNPVFLSISFTFVIFHALALAIEQPHEISFVRDPKTTVTNAFVGQVLERGALISIGGGIGPVIVYDVLPEQFELVEGTNYRIFWKWLRPINAQISYKFRCTKRGTYNLYSPSYESRHPLNIRDIVRGEKAVWVTGNWMVHLTKESIPLSSRDPESTLTVRPRLLNVRRVRDTRTLSNIPLPIGSIAKGGIPTTDFRELREYTQGDTYDSINWKATAKFVSRGFKLPFVNVFEKEGKKTVWLILDISGPMSIGTNVKNALDHAVEAMNALSYFYLERGCSVGLHICTKQGVTKAPDVGRRQYQTILRELINVQTTSSIQPLVVAAGKCGKYAKYTNPLFIILTCLTPASGPSIVQGVREARRYTRAVRGKYSVIVVDVIPYGLISTRSEERLSARMLRALTGQDAYAIKRNGALLVRWDPIEYGFPSVMLRGMRA